MKDDVISRQAAIDRAVSIPMFGRDVKMVAVSEIKNLPSAQPDNDRIWEALSTVYNMADVPDEAKAIIGDVMLGLDEQSAQQKPLKYTGESICLYCWTVNCDGCMYEPVMEVKR